MSEKSLFRSILRSHVRWLAPLAGAFALTLLVVIRPVPTSIAAEESAASEESQGDDGEADDRESGEEEDPESRVYTDEDLEKYHQPRPEQDDQGSDGEGTGDRPARGKEGPKTPASARPAVRPPAMRQHAPLKRTPLKVAPQPSRDPLKAVRDREARERFRSEQIMGLRDRIATLEKRLDYLRQRRIAVVNPLYLMPKPPPGEEAAEDDSGVKPKELLARIEAEIASTEAEIEKTRETLLQIETRFGHEAGLR